MPVYRVEDYIRNSIQSVLNQTVQDYELILVDDESPDNCPEICDEYADKYPQIRVIHQKNTGLSGARNCGFKHIAGKYVCFLDSDDTIQPDLLEYFDKILIKEPDAEFIFTDFQRVKIGDEFKIALYDNGYDVYTDIFKIQDKFLTRQLQILAPGSLYAVEWYRLNKREFLNNPFGEDQLFILYSLLCVNKVIHVKKPLYNYLTRPNSIMTGSNYKKILKAYPFFQEVATIYNASSKASPLVKKYLLPRWCASVCHSAARNSTYTEYRQFLKNVHADKYIPQLLSFPSLKTKLLSLIYVLSVKLYYIVNGKSPL